MTISRNGTTPPRSTRLPPAGCASVCSGFGTARRVVIDGREIFSFPTVWNSVPPREQRQRVELLKVRLRRMELKTRMHKLDATDEQQLLALADLLALSSTDLIVDALSSLGALSADRCHVTGRACRTGTHR